MSRSESIHLRSSYGSPFLAFEAGCRCRGAGYPDLLNPRLPLPRGESHEQSKDQQNRSPPEININPERTLVHVRIRSKQAKQHQHSTINREHVADWHPTIESHNTPSFRFKKKI